jgi:hypothetical protein
MAQQARPSARLLRPSPQLALSGWSVVFGGNRNPGERLDVRTKRGDRRVSEDSDMSLDAERESG